MKLLLENWRKYLKEDFGAPSTGASTIQRIPRQDAYGAWDPGYGGEHGRKLTRLFLNSAAQAISIAEMMPDTDKLVAEFKNIHEMVKQALHIAANPGSEYDEEEEKTFDHLTITSVDSMEGVLLDFSGGIDDFPEKEFDSWEEGIDGLGKYWSYELANRPPHNPMLKDAINNFEFIKKWAGGEEWEPPVEDTE